MHIGIDISSAVNQKAGIGRYTHKLVEHLLEIDNQNEYALFTFYREKGSQEVCFKPNPRLKQKSFSFPGRAFRLMLFSLYKIGIPLDFLVGKVDIFHSPDLVFPALKRTKSILTIHDLAFILFPECYTLLNRQYLKSMVPLSARRASKIIADSQSAKQNIIELLSIPEGKIKVIPCGIDEQFQVIADKAYIESIKRKYGLKKDYILYVGTLEPRKNIGALLQAFHQLKQKKGFDFQLVIAGGKGWLYEKLFKRVRELKLTDDVLFTGYVPEEDLPALYNGAALFVYPSLYEGFGLPVLEAMACGTPVVTSNSSSLPEVVGDAALLVDPKDAEGLAQAIEKVLSGSALQQELVQKGLRRAEMFSWEKTARETLKVYEEVGQDT